MAQKHALVSALKQALKEHGITYDDVAKALNLSLGSVKRLFSKQDFSIDRLDQICGMMDLELSDLVSIMQNQRDQIEALSQEQENELVSDTKLLLTAHLLMNNWSANDILAAYEIDTLQMVRYLARLDKMKVIELFPGNRVKLKVSREFKWINKGPIETFFKTHVQSDFLHSDFNGPGEIRVFLSGMISRNSNAELIRRIKRLANAFEEIHREDINTDLSNKFGTSMVLAMRPWDIELFEKFRRTGTYKSF